MTDQPVTPDREALAREMGRHYSVHGGVAARCGCGWTGKEVDRQAHLVDALLPLLTDALDRARQQGRNEAAAAIEAEANSEEHGLTAYWMHRCARLARGGPNRKDEE